MSKAVEQKERKKSWSKHTGVAPHSSGAIWLFDEQDPQDPYHRAAFICSNYFKGEPTEARVSAAAAGRVDLAHPDCLGKSFGWLQNLYTGTWQGLCAGCRPDKGMGHGRPVDENVTVRAWPETPGGPEGPPIAEVLYEQATATGRVRLADGGVTVKFLLCGHAPEMTRGSVATLLSAHRHGRRQFPKYCRDCFRSPQKLLEILQRVAAGNGDAQKSGGEEKRGRGRPVEDRSPQHEQMKARFEDVILKLGRELPRHKIKRPAIVTEYHGRGERIDPSTVTKRVQLFYGEGVSVEEAVALVLDGNRENKSAN